jgi:hypothetical protein
MYNQKYKDTERTEKDAYKERTAQRSNQLQGVKNEKPSLINAIKGKLSKDVNHSKETADALHQYDQAIIGKAQAGQPLTPHEQQRLSALHNIKQPKVERAAAPAPAGEKKTIWQNHTLQSALNGAKQLGQKALRGATIAGQAVGNAAAQVGTAVKAGYQKAMPPKQFDGGQVQTTPQAAPPQVPAEAPQSIETSGKIPPKKKKPTEDVVDYDRIRKANSKKVDEVEVLRSNKALKKYA